MGVPKFFRWLSERYPAISQLIAENRIPEFDCLYLDMNGIIHNCTHKDSDVAVTKHVTEDEMFIKIFNYIEHLFGKIKPQKLFFMAIDGVAPRAKMNQQRSRRFRTARDAEETRAKAIKEGTELPKEDPFDSNCITPGTEFMARLTQQLKYFIAKKVSEDIDWQGCEVVLSGHEVPGEGEHKIMEYIRQAKSQPNYDPNVRHCLYGLDADLIMLGLLSHDPHFCLLREEVTFGRQGKSKNQDLEYQNFYLMHLCIVREYLELEFQELKEPNVLGAGVQFDMERIIDDFILMAFFVGNDFLPNLPHLHINEGALALMFGVYKQVLPKAGGYINEGGVINLKRLELLLDALSDVEYRFFEHENQDANWLKDKSFVKEDVMEKVKRKGGQVVMTTAQSKLYQQIKSYVNTGATTLSNEHAPLDLPTTLKAADRTFVTDLATSLHMGCNNVADDDGNRHLQLSFPQRPEMDGEEDDDDEEAQNALLRVFKRYDRAKIEEVSAEDARDKAQQKYEQRFQGWKNKHYTEKFEWGLENEGELRNLTENYVQGLQWVLFYYYRGVASWPWYYQYHYAPMISDVKKGLGANMHFELGQPFRPFQQLMGVLPDRSKKIVPPVYWDLMTSPDSPVIDFYPRDFELDMNGKKQDWEAIVKIPFINEKRLLEAMKPKDAMLTPDEQQRNSFGVTMKFTYDGQTSYTYPSSLPGIFPDLENCHCVENIFELPTMEGLDVYVGLVEGVKLREAALAGFPTLHSLPFTGQLGFHGVSVFQQDSRNETMVVTLTDGDEKGGIALAKARLGKAVHVGYPSLQEGKVTSVSDEMFSYHLGDLNLPAEGTNVIQLPHPPQGVSDWRKKASRIENVYSKRLGMIIGGVESLVQVEMLVGLRKTEQGAMIKEYAPIPGMEPDYATQTVVDHVISEDQRFLEKAALPIAEDFPIGTKAFFLGDMAYGRPLEVTGHQGERAEVWVSVLMGKEPEFGHSIARAAENQFPYIPSFQVAKMLHLHPLVLSKLTSAFNVSSSGLRLNLGLNLKFEARKQKVLGYSRKGATGWEYSQKAIGLLAEYMRRFPEFIARIEANPTGDGWEDTAFYPDPQEAKAKMKEIGSWLKTVETKGLERVPLEAEQLDGDTVKLIEQAADQNNQSGVQMQGKKIGSVPRMALLKPSDAEQRTGNQRFRIGDRVAYVLDSGKVPIAMRGTVIGMTRTTRQTLLDVVFDSTFMSGSTLSDRCSPFRGSTVPSNAVLNLSDRQVLALSEAAKARAPQSNYTPLRASGANTASSYGMPGGPQLREASAPAALRGGWRGAVAGGPNGGAPRGGYNPRGQGTTNGTFQQNIPYHTQTPNGTARGGANGWRGSGSRGGRANPQGFTVVDNADPTDGVVAHNPHFRKQNYTNVPPPAGLDAARGRGRGRGGERGSTRGRGNGGGRGRGRGEVLAG
ncbi:XRN 5'-3' exonuclease N-terminus-domain-containing protein [Neohortaea acidophila]|uniref:5'-3' exoribonuclease 1 n=1 Tax=Neohortaea acidophila TaxID=245834 RepID=A0A6A6PV13_9PEZI|nr:XRN 5'-3' exonuclease N-terminus-domain-containing protein [Neohortaea acidophila]KAF2483293.1 XRN 5'-3' exonuclease N-terminus-domain-containing protein [Neohortaea acidophila]